MDKLNLVFIGLILMFISSCAELKALQIPTMPKKEVVKKEVVKKDVVDVCDNNMNFEGKWQTAKDYKFAWEKDLKEGTIYDITKSSSGYNIKITSDVDSSMMEKFNIKKDDYFAVSDIELKDSSLGRHKFATLGWKEGVSAATKCGLDSKCPPQIATMFFPGGVRQAFNLCQNEIILDQSCQGRKDMIYHTTTNKIAKEDRFFCMNVKGEYVNNPALSKSSNKAFKKQHNMVGATTFVRLSAIKPEFDGDL